MNRSVPNSLMGELASMRIAISRARSCFPDLMTDLPGIERLETAVNNDEFPESAVEQALMRHTWMRLQELLAGERRSQITQGVTPRIPNKIPVRDLAARASRAEMETRSGGEQARVTMAACQRLLRLGPVLEIETVSRHITERLAQLRNLNPHDVDLRLMISLINRIQTDDLGRLEDIFGPHFVARRGLLLQSLQALLPMALDRAKAAKDEQLLIMLDHYRPEIERLSACPLLTEEAVERLRKAHARTHVRIFRELIPYDALCNTSRNASSEEITMVPLSGKSSNSGGNGGSGRATIVNMTMDDSALLAADADYMDAHMCVEAPMPFLCSLAHMIRV